MERRRFLTMLGAAAAGVVAAACGVRDSDSAAVPATTTSTATAAPTTTQAATTTTSTSTTTTAATTTVPSPSTIQAICKEAWGAQPVAGDFRTHRIGQITVHHTAVLLDSNRDAPARARQHQAYHQSLGWPDLAYHYLIDAAGNVYEGRPVTAIGDTATDDDPTGHLLICCEGHFDRQQVPAAQYAALIEMLAWGAAEFDVDPAAIRGHRDLASTTCPGDALYVPISDGTLQAAVADALRQGAAALELICGSAAATRVAAIEVAAG